MTNTFAVPNIHGLAPGSALPAPGDITVTPEDFLGDPGEMRGAPPLTFAGPCLLKIQPTQTWLADIVRGTTNANMHRPHADAPMPGGALPLAPIHIPQHQQPFGDIYPQVTPTNPFAGSGILRQTDVQSTDSMEMAQYAAFANLNLGGTSRNQYILDKTRPGVAANMYPDTAGPDPEYPSCTDDKATDQGCTSKGRS